MGGAVESGMKWRQILIDITHENFCQREGRKEGNEMIKTERKKTPSMKMYTLRKRRGLAEFAKRVRNL